MNKSLSFNLVLVAGSVNREQSLAAAEAALDAHIAETETRHAGVASAVEAIFDQYRGEALTMPDIAFLAGQKLNATPSNRKALEAVTLDYIRANSGERASGKLFGIKKGVGGGVSRWSDVPEKTETTESTESK